MHSSITGSAPTSGASNIRTAEPPPPAPPSPPPSPRARLVSQHGVPPLRPPVQPQMRRGPSASGSTGSGEFIVDIDAAVHQSKGKGKQPAITTQERGEGSGAAPIGVAEFADTAFVEPEAAVSNSFHIADCMGDEKNGYAARPQLVNLAHATLAEVDVAHGQRFIH